MQVVPTFLLEYPKYPKFAGEMVTPPMMEEGLRSMLMVEVLQRALDALELVLGVVEHPIWLLLLV